MALKNVRKQSYTVNLSDSDVPLGFQHLICKESKIKQNENSGDYILELGFSFKGWKGKQLYRHWFNLSPDKVRYLKRFFHYAGIDYESGDFEINAEDFVGVAVGADMQMDSFGNDSEPRPTAKNWISLDALDDVSDNEEEEEEEKEPKEEKKEAKKPAKKKPAPKPKKKPAIAVGDVVSFEDDDGDVYVGTLAEPIKGDNAVIEIDEELYEVEASKLKKGSEAAD